MPRVQVTLPTMLATLVRGDRQFIVEANDIKGVVEALLARHPELRVHLLDEDGAVRQHVALFHNDHAARFMVTPVADGDTFTVLQAVSGGGATVQVS